mgnify:CR=1 FL=1
MFCRCLAIMKIYLFAKFEVSFQMSIWTIPLLVWNSFGWHSLRKLFKHFWHIGDTKVRYQNKHKIGKTNMKRYWETFIFAHVVTNKLWMIFYILLWEWSLSTSDSFLFPMHLILALVHISFSVSSSPMYLISIYLFLVVFFLFYLTMAMYCSWSQRPSPSADGWGMVLVDYDGQMVSGDNCGLNFLTFVLQLRENSRKNLNQETDPTGI